MYNTGMKNRSHGPSTQRESRKLMWRIFQRFWVKEPRHSETIFAKKRFRYRSQPLITWKEQGGFPPKGGLAHRGLPGRSPLHTHFALPLSACRNTSLTARSILELSFADVAYLFFRKKKKKNGGGGEGGGVSIAKQGCECLRSQSCFGR